MKIIALLTMVMSLFCYAAGTSVTASGGDPIPAAFSYTNTQSRVMECKGNVVEVLNQTATVLSVGFGTSSSVPSFDYVFVPAGPASGHSFKPKGGFSGGTYVYIRGLSSITSGTVQVSCYYEEP